MRGKEMKKMDKGTNAKELRNVITKITKNQCLSDLPGTLSRVLVGLHFLEFNLD